MPLYMAHFNEFPNRALPVPSLPEMVVNSDCSIREFRTIS